MRQIAMIVFMFLSINYASAFTGCAYKPSDYWSMDQLQKRLVNSHQNGFGEGNKYGIYHFEAMQQIFKNNTYKDAFVIKITLKNFITDKKLNILYYAHGSNGNPIHRAQIESNLLNLNYYILNNRNYVKGLRLQSFKKNNYDLVFNRSLIKKHKLSYIYIHSPHPCPNPLNNAQTMRNLLDFYKINKHDELNVILEHMKNERDMLCAKNRCITPKE